MLIKLIIIRSKISMTRIRHFNLIQQNGQYLSNIKNIY